MMEMEAMIAISGEVALPDGGDTPFESSKREPAWMGDGDDNYWA